MEAEPQYVAETLRWCNEVRALKGMPPLDVLPRGRRNDPLSCPCGKATGAAVESLYYYPVAIAPLSPEERRTLPLSVQNFVHDFDEGRLPKYDEMRARRADDGR